MLVDHFYLVMLSFFCSAANLMDGVEDSTVQISRTFSLPISNHDYAKLNIDLNTIETNLKKGTRGSSNVEKRIMPVEEPQASSRKKRKSCQNAIAEELETDQPSEEVPIETTVQEDYMDNFGKFSLESSIKFPDDFDFD